MSALGQCSTCGKQEQGMKWCSKCKVRFYCSQHCQQLDWGQHKITCSPMTTGGGKTKTEDSDQASGGKPKTEGVSDNTSRIKMPGSLQKNFGTASDNKKPGEGNLYFIFSGFDKRTGKPFTPEQIDRQNNHVLSHARGTLPAPVELKPMELQRLVVKVKSTLLSNKLFYQIPSSTRLRFITDFAQMKSDEDYDLDPLWTWNLLILAKIVDLDEYQTNRGIIISDENYTRLVVHFHTETAWPYFRWNQLKPGNFICIQSPKRHPFLDGQIGIRINSADSVRILSPTGQCLSGK